LLADGAVLVGPGTENGSSTTPTGPIVACADLSRVLYVTCPYPPGSGVIEPWNPGPWPYGTVGQLYVPTDGSLAAENRIRTKVANLVPNAIINTDRDPIDYGLDTFFQDMDRFGAVAALFVLIVGAFGLTASMVGGLIERRRPFALLRASGVHLGELRRAVLLETAATMTMVSVAGVAIGMLLAYASTRQGDVAWRWPGPDVYGLIAGGVLAALLFSTIALPLLNVTTRHDAVRFE
jgi:ABC-type antimicrobial peptide transport system permease subunit